MCGEKHLFSYVRRGALDRENRPQASIEGMLPDRRTQRSIGLLLGLLITGAGSSPLHAQSLRGSSGSLDRQTRAARQHDYTYIDTADRVRYFADKGWLVRVRPSSDFDLHAVSFPYARPEVDLFAQRLASQYRSACGEKLVVTSLTRPTTRQPRNASDRSVHPTGMALDLRYSGDRRCRRWLESVLLDLERAGVLEATLERHPVHYHVALFPHPYASYVETRMAARAVEAAEEIDRAYTVQSGDSLWGIARTHGISVNDLKNVNGLDDARIYPGQVLSVPLGS